MRQLKAARTLLRDFNTAAKQQWEQQVEASEAAMQHLKSIRQDLDHAYSCIRWAGGVSNVAAAAADGVSCARQQLLSGPREQRQCGICPALQS